MLSIIRRFFEAIDILKSERSIVGLNEFCAIHNLNITRYYSLKKLMEGGESRYKSIEVEALYVLAKEYDYSLDWLFFGTGPSRRKQEEVVNCRPCEVVITKVGFKFNA